jgi:hypothetical protein
MQPESKFKRRIDAGFDAVFGKRPDAAYRTAITAGLGQRAGLPDRFYAGFGGHCWLEAKVGDGRLSGVQEQVLVRFARAGVRAVVAVGNLAADDMHLVEFDAEGAALATEPFPICRARDPSFWRRVLQKEPCHVHEG